MENLTGKQIGPYQIVAPLGEGGMAAVYRAYQPGMDRYVALKILPQHFAQDPQFVGRFTQEAKVLARLQHPHILPVHDSGEASGYTYLTMPLIESGTLKDLLIGKPLPLKQIHRIISQVGDALDYAHSRGLVHRDIKPSNVLVDERGNCLLTDFGIAKIIEANSRLTATGGIIGTPAYMAPEQGRGAKVDHRADIYALGVMLYEMATGRPPFDAETPVAVIFQHIHDPLPPPRVLNPDLPEALECVILKALAKDPDDRFQTAGALVEALNAEAVMTRPPVELLPSLAGRSSPTPVKPAAPDPDKTNREPVNISSGINAASAARVPKPRVLWGIAAVLGIGGIGLAALLTMAAVFALPGIINGALLVPTTAPDSQPTVIAAGQSLATEHPATNNPATTTPSRTLAAASTTPQPSLVAPTETRTAILSPVATLLPTLAPSPSCAAPEYFADVWNAHSRLGCATDSVTSDFTSQNFQGGMLFWQKSPGPPMIFAIFSAGYWQKQLDPGGPGGASCAEAEATSLGPIFGFGVLWCQNTSWRQQLGLPTNQETSAGNNPIQYFENGTVLTVGGAGRFILYADGNWQSF